MALETATYISGLNSANPVGATDPKSQGDDHLRLIKATLLNTFPNVTGAVTATQAELNILDGATLSTAELNILDGVTATAAELNILDGVTVTASELNRVDALMIEDIAALTDPGADTVIGWDDSAGAIINVTLGQGIGMTAGGALSIDHDATANYVANEHINHSSVSILSGNGITSGSGGDLTASRTITVGAGDGISVTTNDVNVDSTVVRTTGTQTIGGAKTFTSAITMSGTLAVDATTRLNLTGATVSVGESGGNLGFYGSAGTDKIAVTGSRSQTGEAGALNILLNALETMGLITNSTT